MADSTDSSPGMIGQRGAQLYGAAPASRDRGGTVVVEFLDAARSAAESVLEEQRRQVVQSVSGMAEALRCAIGPLARSRNGAIARLVEQAADRVEDFSLAVCNRRWNDLVADTEEFARRQPTLFVLGAAATGFLLGRFLGTATGWQQRGEDTSGETTRAVAAAVSSGTGAADAAIGTPLPSGGAEIR